MNNDLNNNTRTLIVSFAIAIMFLIPLRFVEVGNMMSMSTEAQVLGESIVLPNAEVKVPLLEAPYNQTEGAVLGESTSLECISSDEAMKQIEGYSKILDVVKGNDLQTEAIVKAVLEVEKNTCK